MSRMFHRVFAASTIGAAALAAPATALAAESGPAGAGGAQTPTSVVLHLPQLVRAGQPIMVTARVTALDAARDPAAPQGTTESLSKGKGRGKGHGTTKNGSGRRKGAGHGRSGSAHRRPVTGEIVFFLDGRAEPPAEINRGTAGEKLDIPLGRHTLVAEYTGDSEYESARSAPVTFELAAGRPVDGQGQQPQGSPDGGYGQDQGGYGQDQGGYGQDGFDGGGQGQDGQGQDGPGMYAPEQGAAG